MNFEELLGQQVFKNHNGVLMTIIIKGDLWGGFCALFRILLSVHRKTTRRVRLKQRVIILLYRHECMGGAKKLRLPTFLPPISTWTLERWLKDVTRESSLWFTASCEWLNVSICLLISTSLFCLCITLAAWTDALSALISSLNFSTSSFAFLSLSKAMASWSLRLWRGKENDDQWSSVSCLNQ